MGIKICMKNKNCTVPIYNNNNMKSSNEKKSIKTPQGLFIDLIVVVDDQPL